MEKSVLRGRGRVLVAVAVTAAVLAAIWYAHADRLERVAGDAETVALSQAIVTEYGAVRAGLGVTLVLASAIDAAVPVEETPDQAIATTVARADEARNLAERLEGDLRVAELAAEISEGLEGVASYVRADDTAGADALAGDSVLPLVDELEVRAATLGSAASSRIAAERSDAGTAAVVSGMAVALIVPAFAVWSVRRASRRRIHRLRLEQELDRRRTEVEAREQMIGAISHQLRTPLTGIYGFARAMLDAGIDDAATRDGLVTISHEAAELNRMIDDLMVRAKIETEELTMHIVDVDPIREVDLVLEDLGGSRVGTSLVPARVSVDRLRLRHIVRNLVSNAIAHGGPDVTIAGAPMDDVYRIAIADNGAGLPEHLVSDPFQAFVHEPRKATVTGSLGIGLSVAKTLSDRMGCRLEYVEIQDQTVFILDLPLARTPAEGATVASTRLRARRGVDAAT